MSKKVINILVGFCLIQLSLIGCSSSKKTCTNDSDCDVSQFCGEDNRCQVRPNPDGFDGADDTEDNQPRDTLDGSDDPDGFDGADDTVDDQPSDTLDGSDGQNDNGDQGPQGCSHDRECPNDKICDLSTGDCVDGTTLCQQDFHCDIDTEYCDPIGQICKRRSDLCEPCLQDFECPDPSEGDMCILYTDGNKYCGRRCGQLLCPVGYDCDLSVGSGSGPNPGQCRSNTGSCQGTFVCHEDKDCAGNMICEKMTGKCKPKCEDDTGCPVNQKCHLSGHCGPVCDADTDCTQYGNQFICCITQASSPYCDANSIGRCRPNGCALHSECPESGDSLGYCAKTTGVCMTGCRHADALTVNDCKAGMKCECEQIDRISCDQFDCCPDPGQGDCLCDPMLEDCSQLSVCNNGQCVEIPCHEYENIHIACGRSQFCCGWPPDGYSCPNGINQGDCYFDKPNVCQSCQQEGQVCNVPGFGYGEPGICRTDVGDSNLYCHIGCRDTQDCPSRWQCDFSYIQDCQDPSQCLPSASCDLWIRQYDENGQVQEASVCHCQSDSDCPPDANGFRATCEPVRICLDPDNPGDCSDGMACMWGKACQCANCCSQM